MKANGKTTQRETRPLIADSDAAKVVRVMKARALSGDAGAATVVLMLHTGLLSRPAEVC